MDATCRPNLQSPEAVSACPPVQFSNTSTSTEKHFNIVWLHVMGLFIYLFLRGGGEGVLCAAAIHSRDPSSDLKHKYATTQMCQGCTRCQVCWAVMSKADSLLRADPESPLPSWPRQLPSLGPRTHPQGERHKSAAFKNKTANFSSLEALKLNLGDDVSEKHLGFDSHKCCRFVRILHYNPSSILPNDFCFSVRHCVFQDFAPFSSFVEILAACRNVDFTLMFVITYEICNFKFSPHYLDGQQMRWMHHRARMAAENNSRGWRRK